MEMIVAVTVFAVIILAAVRIFQASLQAQQDISWDYTLQSDSQYFLNVLARELEGAQRNAGGTTVCAVPAGCTFATDGATLNFKNSAGQCVAYDSGVDSGVTKVLVDRDGTSSYLSGSGVDIKNLAFVVADSCDAVSQPLATINLQFNSLNSTSTTAINAQLSISPTLAP